MGPRTRKAVRGQGAFVQQEEALAILRVDAVRSAAAAISSTTGVGVDGFHPRVLLALSDECCGAIFTLLNKVEMAGLWPTNASSTVFFVILESTTSERPIALLDRYCCYKLQYVGGAG